jgi:alpha-beta hydrolase superfamily lysophospholipase
MLEWRSSAPAKIIVVCIHGLGLCAKAYKPLAGELSAAGIDGFGVNVRGFGPDTNKPELSKLDCVKTVDDVSELLTNIHENYPGYRVYLVGESMGAALAIRIAALHPGLIDGLVCSAPAWKILKIRQTVAKGIFELFQFSGTGPGPAARAVMKQATTDPKLTRHWQTDPSHKLKLSLAEARAFLNFVSKTDKYARKIEKPALIIQGLNDRLVSAKGVARLFQDIPSANKTFLIDGTAEHLVLEEGRFSQQALERVVDWMKSDSNSSSGVNQIVVNAEHLSPREKRALSKLQGLFSLTGSCEIRRGHRLCSTEMDGRAYPRCIRTDAEALLQFSGECGYGR